MRRLYKLLVPVCASIWLLSASLHAEITVPVATNLQQDGREALQRKLPILLTFSALFCSYCDQLEEDFLQPMLLSGDYDDKVIIRKLVVDMGQPLIDFDGHRISGGELSDRYRVFVTPTLLFMDGHGNELAERMLGINTPELYGGYLDNCIETARLQIRDPAAAAQLPGCQLEHSANSENIFRTARP